MGRAEFLPCYLPEAKLWSHACTATLSAPNPAAGPHQPRALSEAPWHARQVWVNLLWGHCSFLLGPGAHKFLFVPSKNLFPQSCISSGISVVWLMAAFSKRAYAIPKSIASRVPAPAAVHCWPITSSWDTQTQFYLSLCGVSGFWCAQCLFEPSEGLWPVWGLILNTILPLLPSCWGFSALGHGISPHSRSSTTQPPL